MHLVGRGFYFVPSSGRASHVGEVIDAFIDEHDRGVAHGEVGPGGMHAAKRNCSIPSQIGRLVVVVDVPKCEEAVVLKVNGMSCGGERLEGKILIDAPMADHLPQGKGFGGAIGNVLELCRPTISRDNAAGRNMIVAELKLSKGACAFRARRVPVIADGSCVVGFRRLLPGGRIPRLLISKLANIRTRRTSHDIERCFDRLQVSWIVRGFGEINEIVQRRFFQVWQKLWQFTPEVGEVLLFALAKKITDRKGAHRTMMVV